MSSSDILSSVISTGRICAKWGRRYTWISPLFDTSSFMSSSAQSTNTTGRNDDTDITAFLTIAWYDENDLRPIFLNKKAMID